MHQTEHSEAELRTKGKRSGREIREEKNKRAEKRGQKSGQAVAAPVDLPGGAIRCQQHSNEPGNTHGRKNLEDRKY
jgi:hypothetical protein